MEFFQGEEKATTVLDPELISPHSSHVFVFLSYFFLSVIFCVLFLFYPQRSPPAVHVFVILNILENSSVGYSNN